MPPLGVVFAESVHDRSFRMEVRRDEFDKILYVIRGQIRVEWESGHTLTGKEGAFFAIRHQMPHQIRDLSPSTLLILCMHPSWIADHAARRMLWDRLELINGQYARSASQRTSSTFDRLWRTALLEQHVALVGHELTIGACADQILVHLSRLRQVSRHAGAAERVAGVLQEMETTFHEPWNIEKARERAGLSRHYFTRLFRQSTGKSFVEKLTDLRLNHAALLLERGGHSIAGVAFACGFTDLSHFYRVFRKRFQCPPGQWNKRRRESIPR